MRKWSKSSPCDEALRAVMGDLFPSDSEGEEKPLTPRGGGDLVGGVDPTATRVSQAIVGRQSARHSIEMWRAEPWLDADGEVIWAPIRIKLCKFVSSQQFDSIMGTIILFNICLIIYETDKTADCHPEFSANIDDCPVAGDKIPWLIVTNLVLLSVYTAECLLRLYVHRFSFFRSKWNMLDMFIIVSGFLGEVIGSLISFNILKVFRVARLMRAFRILITFRELYLMVTGFLMSMKAIAWGSFLLGALLVCWSILLVEFIHPINMKLDYSGCERCPRAFETVLQSTLTLFQQIVTGDSWGLVSIPVIMEVPWTVIIFFAIVVTVALGLMNLILAVIVECADEARQSDKRDQIKQKERVAEEEKKELMRQCAEMDIDGGGTLTLAELEEGYKTNEGFRDVLKMMDVEYEELSSVFRILDQDQSGDVNYQEFCDQLHKIRTREERTMIMFMRISLGELKNSVEENLSHVQNDLIPMVEDHARLISDLEESFGTSTSNHGGDEDLQPKVTSLGKLPPAPAGTSGANKAPDSHCKDPRPMPPVPPARLANVDQVGEELARIRKMLEELTSLEENNAKRARDQAAALISQSEALGAITSRLPPQTNLDPTSRPTGHLDLPKDLQTLAGEKLSRLRAIVEDQLSVHSVGLLEKAEEEHAVLHRNSELLASMGELFNVQLPTAGRRISSIRESKSQVGR